MMMMPCYTTNVFCGCQRLTDCLSDWQLVLLSAALCCCHQSDCMWRVGRASAAAAVSTAVDLIISSLTLNQPQS